LRRGSAAPPRTTAGRAYTSGADMAVKLNHTIVHARDKRAAAQFYAEVFGLGAPRPFGPFLDVDTANEVTLAFLQTDQAFEPQHYAFLVSEAEFDRIFGRVKARGLEYWADPAKKEKGRINTHFGGRGVYFEDPSGHFLEIITQPYGGWDEI
jgi:catechol 2,3-dioxygenase-like lactoylglutathione lyase family enzyme